MQLCECECVWRFSGILEWNFVCMKMLQKFIKEKLVSETVNFNLAIRCICVTAAQFLGRLSIRKLFNLKAYVLLAYSPAHRNSYTFLQMNIWRNCNSHSFHQMNFFSPLLAFWLVLMQFHFVWFTFFTCIKFIFTQIIWIEAEKPSLFRIEYILQVPEDELVSDWKWS